MRKQKLALTVGGAISLVLVVATAVITATGLRTSWALTGAP